MNFNNFMPALAALVVVLGALAAIGRKVWRRVSQFLDDWNGEPPRRGVEARPGVMERMKALDDGNLHIIARVAAVEEAERSTAQRLRAIESELHPNGGGSLRDQVNVIRDAVITQERKT